MIMPTFDGDYGSHFDGFGHENTDGPPFETRSRKRGKENAPKVDDLLKNDKAKSNSLSLTETSSIKKTKMTTETNDEKGVMSLNKDTLTEVLKNNGPNQMNGSEVHCQEAIPKSANKKGTTMETVLQDEAKEAQMHLLKWKPPFTESEAFEAFFPSRVDPMLNDVLQIEVHLKNQKEQLRTSLTHLSQTLKIQMK